MRVILHSSFFYVAGAIVLIVAALVLLIGSVHTEKKDLIFASVERGDVTEIVSVSGVVEAKNTAELAFPVSGIVTDVFVEEGEHVKRGDTLATLASAKLVAERADALAALQSAIADRDELIAGPRSEARAVTEQTVENAEANLAKVTAEENEKVKNTRRALLSSSLIARTEDPDETATPPVVSGTYTCEDEGVYFITGYSTNNSQTNYAFRVSGLEGGSYKAFINSPGAFGECGLFLTFDPISDYSETEWIIEVPNTQSAIYQSNLNAYELALTQQEKAIETAENALALAREEATLENATPRTEALARAEALVAQRRARVASIDADIADRSIVAPYDGLVTDVTILRGETATIEPVITLLADGAFELKARIPEIDITKLAVGQRTEILFDARRSELLEGVITFISPLAIEIDGVAYFEATIGFNEVPMWMRSGLNADIDIIVGEVRDVLRVPTRFVSTSESTSSILVHDGEAIRTATVDIGFAGNDGFVEISGIPEGTEIVAP